MSDPGRPDAVVVVDTPQGPGRFLVAEAAAPRAVLVLGHGAGGGVDAPDLLALARALPGQGVTVLRFEQPWRTAGRRVAVAPPRLDEAWLAGLAGVRDVVGEGLPLVTGGRSAGARVACRTADALGVAGVVCLAFPLHLPGRPERSRLAELTAPSAPRLVLQGTRDTFGGPAELAAALDGVPGGHDGVTLVALPGADHSFAVPRALGPGTAATRAEVVARVVDFVAARE